MNRKTLLVALGGGVGTLLRFFIGEGVPALHTWPPFATLLVNVSGCLLISLINFISNPPSRIYIGIDSRLFWMVGFCGGYTTFSTFSFLSLEAVLKKNWSDLWSNILLSHFLCLGAVMLGYLLSKPAALLFAKTFSVLHSFRSKFFPTKENLDE